MAPNELRGHVVRILNSDELILNVGKRQGAHRNMIFAILDAATQNVVDPVTGEDLGSLDREKGRVWISEVGERMSIARAWGRKSNLSETARMLSGAARVPSSDPWLEGIAEGDEVRFTGRSRTVKKPPPESAPATAQEQPRPR